MEGRRPADRGRFLRVRHRANGSNAIDISFSLPFATFVRRRAAGLRRMIGLFGADDGGRGLYAGGGAADLLGRPGARLDTDPAGARVELDTAAIDDFHPGGRLSPSFVTGRIVGEVGGGRPLRWR